DRGDEEIVFPLLLEHGGEQPDQRHPPDRRLLVEPGAVGGDPHVDIATKRRIPALDRRRAPAPRQRCRDRLQSAPPFLRHCFPYVYASATAVRIFVIQRPGPG